MVFCLFELRDCSYLENTADSKPFIEIVRNWYLKRESGDKNKIIDAAVRHHSQNGEIERLLQREAGNTEVVVTSSR